MSMVYCKETCGEVWTECRQYELVNANQTGVQVCDNENKVRDLTWKEYRKYFWDDVCAECGEPLDENEPCYIVNKGLENQFVLDAPCYAYMCELGEIIHCERCGALYTTDICSNNYCPQCHENLTEEARSVEVRKKIKVIVEVEGGIVQNIYTNADDIQVEVYDLDADDEEVKEELEQITEGLRKI